MSAKWDTIYAQQECDSATAAKVLQDNLHLLPNSGVALDLACGLGGNAICLAQHGLYTHAWDISAIALNKLSQFSQQQELAIEASQRDVENNPPLSNSYDVIVVSYFLHRPIMNAICNSLKKGGLLFYQTFTNEKVKDIGPTNPNYLLNKNELLFTCQDMDILVYREEGLQGNLEQGWRNQAMLIAKK